MIDLDSNTWQTNKIPIWRFIRVASSSFPFINMLSHKFPPTKNHPSTHIPLIPTTLMLPPSNETFDLAKLITRIKEDHLWRLWQLFIHRLQDGKPQIQHLCVKTPRTYTRSLLLLLFGVGWVGFWSCSIGIEKQAVHENCFFSETDFVDVICSPLLLFLSMHHRLFSFSSLQFNSEITISEAIIHIQSEIWKSQHDKNNNKNKNKCLPTAKGQHMHPCHH